MNLTAVNRCISLLTRLLDPTKPTQGFLPATAGKPIFSEKSTPYFPRVLPEDVGVSSHAVSRFLRALYENPELHMHTVTLLRNGNVFCEASFGAQDTRIPKYTFSACKSIVSLCIGILVGDGLLSLDDKITDVFSDRVTPMSKLSLGSLCIRDLLTMRSGIVFNELESQTERDWVKAFLTSSVQGKIGTTFSYNSLNTYMLAAVICKKTGMSLSAFAKERLFAPLSITEYFWECCPHGIEKGGWGLYMRAEDLAKLGCLVLSDGRWSSSSHSAQMLNDTHEQVCNDTQIIPEAYLKDALTPHAKTPPAYGAFDYGYQIWISRDTVHPAYLFNGLFGQNVMMFPETNIVLVTNASNPEFFQTSPFYTIAMNAFAQKTKALMPDTIGTDAYPAAQAQLQLRYVQTEIRYHTREALHARRAEKATGEIATTPTAPQMQKPKKSILNHLAALFHKESRKNPPAPTEQNGSTPTKLQHVVLPKAAEAFLNRTFEYAPMYAQKKGESISTVNAVGLMPVLLQAVQGAFSQGFQSISFAKAVSNGDERLLVTYKEETDTHVFAAGYGEAIRTTCTFCGIPFRIAASCRFTEDEDNRDVCILQIDFLETPFSRTIKLFLNPTLHAHGVPDAVLKQEEIPGSALVLEVILNGKDSLSSTPLIGTALDKIDNLYLDYRVRRKFSPELALRVRKTDVENKITKST